MKLLNKTRYAILGVLLDGPASGYEIKSLMGRSTVYFWQESDSTIYPMLKVLAKEGKVASEIAYIGKKKRELFSLTDTGRIEFNTWFDSPTGAETPRNEFLLKLFFATDRKEMIRLFEERLAKVKELLEKFRNIETRLDSIEDSPRRTIRLKALRYGIAQLESEVRWLHEETK